jgi:dTDP-4-amino-4,6-dideoxygalactose transaminase
MAFYAAEISIYYVILTCIVRRKLSLVKKVPFVDLQRQYAPVKDALLESLKEILGSCKFINGPDVKAFETELAGWLGLDEIVACANATSGLYATLRTLGVGPGDEVITTAHTAIPTSEAITMTGARVVFSDIKRDTCNLDPQDVAKKIGAKTKAVVGVHIYGQPVDLEALEAVVRPKGIFLVEDCAQALGAEYGGKKVGHFGDAAVYSFFPSKPLGGFGDGGAVASRNREFLERVRMFCNHGRKSKYSHEFEGFNSRMDTIKAALLRHGIPHLDRWNTARNRAADYYQEHLGDIPQLELPVVLPGATSVWHVYAVRVPDREALRRYLKQKGIGAGIHYPYALNLLPAYAYLEKGRGSYPVAEHHCQHTLSLPMFPEITPEELGYVCKTVRGFFSDH